MAALLAGATGGHARQQDVQDRRWRNMCYYVQTLKAQGREPRTGGDHLRAIQRHGLQPNHPRPRRLLAREIDFGEFMDACGKYGWTCMDSFDAQHEPDAPPKCDKCGTYEAVGFRCASCGEYYCSATCQAADWPDHRPICSAASLVIHGTMPALMTVQRYGEEVLGGGGAGEGGAGLAAEGRHAAGGAAAGTAPCPGDEAAALPGKNAKKNKQRRERAKAAAAERAAAAALGGLSLHEAAGVD
jgi:hypothetical protein